eukprot:5239747-Prymnesium_polylepis.1
MADTHNGLGSLAEKQKKWGDAHGHYDKGLELRKMMPDKSQAEQKARHQAIAQSAVSLSNLAYNHAEDMAKAIALAVAAGQPASQSDHDTQRTLYGEALRHGERAREEYIAGFSPTHPKVAWALESLARAHRKRGELREAEDCVGEAVAIRRSLAESDPDKQLFKKELDKAEQAQGEIHTRRVLLRARLRAANHFLLVSAPGAAPPTGGVAALAAAAAKGK